jgi:hypothetical protein
MENSLKLLIFIIIGISICTNSINFNLLNIDEIKNRNSSNSYLQQLYINLDIEPALISKIDLNKCGICIVINGSVCGTCFDPPIHSIDISIPSSCVSDEMFWIGATIICDVNKIVQRYITSAVKVDAKVNRFRNENQITFILPLYLDDLARAAVLFQSLEIANRYEEAVYEMIIFVPPAHFSILNATLNSLASKLLFPVRILNESILFFPSYLDSVYPYGLQMAIKLLASFYVETSFYITLDADVILLRPLSYSNMIKANKALFQHESRSVHDTWWKGSSDLLGVSDITLANHSQDGFGVTPAILSTYGSMLTILSIYDAIKLHLKTHNNELIANLSSYQAEREIIQRVWLESFGRNGVIWSEVMYIYYKNSFCLNFISLLSILCID